MSEPAIKFVQVAPEDLERMIDNAVERALAKRLQPANEPEWLTSAQAAKLMNCAPRTVQHRVLHQGLRATKAGKDWRLKPADVRAWMAKNGS
jgi:excisionase family DNA binding protein